MSNLPLLQGNWTKEGKDAAQAKVRAEERHRDDEVWLTRSRIAHPALVSGRQSFDSLIKDTADAS
jgi:hypothetical protein